jgi:hypothetical protein
MFNIHLSILVDEKTRDAVKKTGYKKDMSISEVVRLALKEFFENEKKRNTKK